MLPTRLLVTFAQRDTQVAILSPQGDGAPPTLMAASAEAAMRFVVRPGAAPGAPQSAPRRVAVATLALSQEAAASHMLLPAAVALADHVERSLLPVAPHANFPTAAPAPASPPPGGRLLPVVLGHGRAIGFAPLAATALQHAPAAPSSQLLAAASSPQALPPAAPSVPLVSRSSSPYVCHYAGCMRRFNRREALKRHERLHFLHHCTHCSCQFASLNALHAHKRMHLRARRQNKLEMKAEPDEQPPPAAPL